MSQEFKKIVEKLKNPPTHEGRDEKCARAEAKYMDDFDIKIIKKSSYTPLNI
jgi:hypothetical protein